MENTPDQLGRTTAAGQDAPYGTGPSPVYFGSGFLPGPIYWKLGTIFGVVYMAAFFLVTVPWVMFH
jgi:di/tricarboxylate transporter